MGSTQVIRADDAVVRVLVVEDEHVTAQAVASFIRRQHGWSADVARDGDEALRMFDTGAYSVVLIDLGLPESGPDGIDLCRRLRAASRTVALIVVTGRDALEDELRAFEAGADDYLTKPVEPELLKARAKAVVRRSSASPTGSGMRAAARPLGTSDLFLDRDSGEARGPGGAVQLTRLELLLLVRCESSGPIALTSEAIAAAVLGRRDHAAKNLVHRHIANIRSKLASVGIEESIVRTPLGYVLRKR